MPVFSTSEFGPSDDIIAYYNPKSKILLPGIVKHHKHSFQEIKKEIDGTFRISNLKEIGNTFKISNFKDKYILLFFP